MNTSSHTPQRALALVLLLAAACTGTLPIAATTTPAPTEPPTETLLPSATPIPSETPPPTSTPEGAIGSTWTRGTDGMVMVYVPQGVFTMGSDGGEADETPVHGVILDAFWIDRTEVTYGMFAQFAPDSGNKGPARFPVIHVSWDQAAAYCKWARSRLPSEAEWEKAARGADERTYPWGDQAPAADLVNFADLSSHAQVYWADTTVDDGNPGMAPVGRYPAGASPYGALDMAGNVAEWVNDWYDPAYYAQFALLDPPGPEAGDFRVLRGGSWYSTAAGVRTVDRAWYIPEGGTNYAGFRCARSTVAP